MTDQMLIGAIRGLSAIRIVGVELKRDPNVTNEENADKFEAGLRLVQSEIGQLLLCQEQIKTAQTDISRTLKSLTPVQAAELNSSIDQIYKKEHYLDRTEEARSKLLKLRDIEAKLQVEAKTYRSRAERDTRAELLSHNRSMRDLGGNFANQSFDAGQPASIFQVQPIRLEKFGGDRQKWMEFFESFRAATTGRVATNIEKFQLLRTLLEGEPKELIRGFKLEDANFEVAMQLLKDTYGIKEDLVRSLHSELSALKQCYSLRDSKEFVLKLERITRELANAGEDIEGPPTYLMLEKKLTPTFLRHILEKKNEDPAAWNTTKFRETLGAAVRKEDYIQEVIGEYGSRNRPPPPPPQHKRFQRFIPGTERTFTQSTYEYRGQPQSQRNKTQGKIKIQTKPSGTMPKQNENGSLKKQSQFPNEGRENRPSHPCVFCGQPHWQNKCTKYTNATQRYTIAREKGLCLKCLRTGHQSNVCMRPAQCYHCKKGHPTALCRMTFPNSNQTSSVNETPGKKVQSTTLKKSASTNNKQSNSVNEQCNVVRAKDTQALLMTTVATIFNPSQPHKSMSVNVFIDTGSHRSFVSERVAQRLDLPRICTEECFLTSFGNQKAKKYITDLVKVGFLCSNGERLIVSLNKLKFLVKDMPIVNVSKLDEVELNRERLDPPFKMSNPDVMLGIDYWHEINVQAVKRLPSGFTLCRSKVGKILSGTGKLTMGQQAKVTFVLCADATDPEETQQEDDPNIFTTEDDIKESERLNQFFGLHIVGLDDATLPDDKDQIMQHFRNNLCLNKNRYEVSLPWNDRQPMLPTNYHQAKARLIQLIKKLRNENLIEDYNAIFEDQLNKGIIELVTSEMDPSGPIHYLPHRAVVRRDKETTKIRVVMDASARPKTMPYAPSLNECLHQGPGLLKDLAGILLRFRQMPRVLIADIQAAFLQLALRSQDRDATRFLWFQNPTSIPERITSGDLITYRFCRVSFGLNVSPFLLNATLHEHLAMMDTELARKIETNIYVDNVIVPLEQNENVERTIQEAKRIFKDAGMELRAFLCTEAEKLNHLPKEELAANQTETKILGLKWKIPINRIIMLFLPFEGKLSKRNVLAHIAKHYDPLGLIGPALLPAKLLLQRIQMQNIGWDTQLGQPYCDEWNKIMKDWTVNGRHQLSVTFPRYIHTGHKVEYHAFADASSSGMGLAVYQRSNLDKPRMHAQCNLIFAKSLIKPLKLANNELTIPRLELQALTMAVKIIQYLRKELQIEESEIRLWTDSQCTISRLKENKRQDRYVANRVVKIRAANLSVYHVKTEDNPADLASRGTDPLTLDNSQLWKYGPKWLVDPSSSWPASIEEYHPGDEFKEEPEIMEFVSTIQQKTFEPIFPIENYSKWSKAQAVAAFMLRFLQKIDKRKNLVNLFGMALWPPSSRKWPSPNELSAATEWLIMETQRKYPPSDGQKRSLNMRMQNDLWICESRMGNADLQESARNPIYLPPQSWTTKLIILNFDRNGFHPGIKTLLSNLRTWYWIPRGRQTIIRTLYASNGCLQCRLARIKPYKYPFPPDLPKERVTMKRPFTYTGVDYFGPMTVKLLGDKSGVIGLPRVKVYVALFTCLSIRAIHMEIADDYSASSFLSTFRRFCARRGVPSLMMSDQATNFVLGSKVIKESWKETLLPDEVQATLARGGTSWTFITAHSPWRGGAWERMVGLVKSSLRRCIGKALLSRDELHTLMCEVESIVNSRPLTFESESEPLQSLRPIDFLIPYSRTTTNFPWLEENVEDPEYRLRRDLGRILREDLEIVARRLDKFWNSWKQEYLLTLRDQQYSKEGVGERQPQVGDVILVEDRELPRSQWDLGIILKILKSKDGQSRTAVIKTKSREATLPTNLLYDLEIVDRKENNISNDDSIDSHNEQSESNDVNPPLKNRRIQPQRKAKNRFNQMSVQEGNRNSQRKQKANIQVINTCELAKKIARSERMRARKQPEIDNQMRKNTKMQSIEIRCSKANSQILALKHNKSNDPKKGHAGSSDDPRLAENREKPSFSETSKRNRRYKRKKKSKAKSKTDKEKQRYSRRTKIGQSPLLMILSLIGVLSIIIENALAQENAISLWEAPKPSQSNGYGMALAVLLGGLCGWILRGWAIGRQKCCRPECIQTRKTLEEERKETDEWLEESEEQSMRVRELIEGLRLRRILTTTFTAEIRPIRSQQRRQTSVPPRRQRAQQINRASTVPLILALMLVMAKANSTSLEIHIRAHGALKFTKIEPLSDSIELNSFNKNCLVYSFHYSDKKEIFEKSMASFIDDDCVSLAGSQDESEAQSELPADKSNQHQHEERSEKRLKKTKPRQRMENANGKSKERIEKDRARDDDDESELRPIVKNKMGILFPMLHAPIKKRKFVHLLGGSKNLRFPRVTKKDAGLRSYRKGPSPIGKAFLNGLMKYMPEFKNRDTVAKLIKWRDELSADQFRQQVLSNLDEVEKKAQEREKRDEERRKRREALMAKEERELTAEESAELEEIKKEREEKEKGAERIRQKQRLLGRRKFFRERSTPKTQTLDLYRDTTAMEPPNWLEYIKEFAEHNDEAAMEILEDIKVIRNSFRSPRPFEKLDAFLERGYGRNWQRNNTEIVWTEKINERLLTLQELAGLEFRLLRDGEPFAMKKAIVLFNKPYIWLTTVRGNHHHAAISEIWATYKNDSEGMQQQRSDAPEDSQTVDFEEQPNRAVVQTALQEVRTKMMKEWSKGPSTSANAEGLKQSKELAPINKDLEVLMMNKPVLTPEVIVLDSDEENESWENRRPTANPIIEVRTMAIEQEATPIPYNILTQCNAHRDMMGKPMCVERRSNGIVMVSLLHALMINLVKRHEQKPGAKDDLVKISPGDEKATRYFWTKYGGYPMFLQKHFRSVVDAWSESCTVFRRLIQQHEYGPIRFSEVGADHPFGQWIRRRNEITADQLTRYWSAEHIPPLFCQNKRWLIVGDHNGQHLAEVCGGEGVGYFMDAGITMPNVMPGINTQLLILAYEQKMERIMAQLRRLLPVMRNSIPAIILCIGLQTGDPIAPLQHLAEQYACGLVLHSPNAEHIEVLQAIRRGNGMRAKLLTNLPFVLFSVLSFLPVVCGTQNNVEAEQISTLNLMLIIVLLIKIYSSMWRRMRNGRWSNQMPERDVKHSQSQTETGPERRTTECQTETGPEKRPVGTQSDPDNYRWREIITRAKREKKCLKWLYGVPKSNQSSENSLSSNTGFGDIEDECESTGLTEAEVDPDFGCHVHTNRTRKTRTVPIIKAQEWIKTSFQDAKASYREVLEQWERREKNKAQLIESEESTQLPVYLTEKRDNLSKPYEFLFDTNLIPDGFWQNEDEEYDSLDDRHQPTEQPQQTVVEEHGGRRQPTMVKKGGLATAEAILLLTVIFLFIGSTEAFNIWPSNDFNPFFIEKRGKVHGEKAKMEYDKQLSAHYNQLLKSRKTTTEQAATVTQPTMIRAEKFTVPSISRSTLTTTAWSRSTRTRTIKTTKNLTTVTTTEKIKTVTTDKTTRQTTRTALRTVQTTTKETSEKTQEIKLPEVDFTASRTDSRKVELMPEIEFPTIQNRKQVYENGDPVLWCTSRGGTLYHLRGSEGSPFCRPPPALTAQWQPLNINLYVKVRKPKPVENAYQCAVKTVIESYYTNFLGDRFLSSSIEFLPVTREECQKIVKHHVCPYSQTKMTTEDGIIWKSTDAVKVDFPNFFTGIFKGEQRSTATNCFAQPSQLFVRQHNLELMSPIHRMDDCRYKEEYCQLHDNTSLIWTAKCPEGECRGCDYEESERIPGEFTSPMAERVATWISTDREKALTFATKVERTKACDGRLIAISEQSFAIRVEQYEKIADAMKRKRRAVETEQLASQLSASQLATNKAISQLYLRECQRSFRGNPTLQIRRLLKRNDLQARWISEDHLEVMPCTSIPMKALEFRATQQCYKYIPVSVRLENATIEAYLDPELRIISGTSPTASCSGFQQQYLQLSREHNQWVIIDVKSAVVRSIPNTSIIDLYETAFDQDHQIELNPLVFHNWQVSKDSDIPLMPHIDEFANLLEFRDKIHQQVNERAKTLDALPGVTTWVVQWARDVILKVWELITDWSRRIILWYAGFLLIRDVIIPLGLAYLLDPVIGAVRAIVGTRPQKRTGAPNTTEEVELEEALPSTSKIDVRSSRESMESSPRPRRLHFDFKNRSVSFKLTPHGQRRW